MPPAKHTACVAFVEMRVPVAGKEPRGEKHPGAVQPIDGARESTILFPFEGQTPTCLWQPVEGILFARFSTVNLFSPLALFPFLSAFTRFANHSCNAARS